MLPDEYTRNARLTPALIVILPIALVATVLADGSSRVLAAAVGPLTALGLTALLAQIGRDRGKKKEPALFSLWDGKPSVSKLRHRDKTLNLHTRHAYRSAIQSVFPDIPLPTVGDEAEDPQRADEVYEAVSNRLIQNTRDIKKYRLIFQENINYGFRRNLWGMKVWGIGVCAACIVIALEAIWLALRDEHSVSFFWIAAFTVTGLLLTMWLAVITPDWVRIAGDAYAERLLAASEQLAADTGRSKTATAPASSHS